MEKAYGACMCCVYETEQGEQKSYLIYSKTRVASLKVILLPKLELCAALILVRLAAVAEAIRHPVEDIHLWSDSSSRLLDKYATT